MRSMQLNPTIFHPVYSIVASHFIMKRGRNALLVILDIIFSYFLSLSLTMLSSHELNKNKKSKKKGIYGLSCEFKARFSERETQKKEKLGAFVHFHV